MLLAQFLPGFEQQMQVAIYDVFAEKPYGGNQAAVVRVGRRQLSDSQLVALASELSLAETALLSVRKEYIALRFATAGRVINRCGHATLASVAHHLLPRMKSHRANRDWRGRYRIGNSIADWRARPVSREPRPGQARGLDVAITWPDRPIFASKLPARQVYRALGLDVRDVALGLPLCAYNSGNLNALVPVRTVAVLEQIQPDWMKLKSLFEEFQLPAPHNGRLTDLHLYCLQGGQCAPWKVRCRNVFPYGVFEEPATGTASVALATALVDHLTAFKAGNSAATFTFDQGIGKRRGKISVIWQPSLDGQPVIWLEGRVFPIVKGKLVSFPSH
jgi:PhzF family phenazine biosynthesis protein